MNPKRKNLAKLALKYGIKLIILFGSAAKQNKKPEDFDVAVFFENGKEKKYMTNIQMYNNIWIELAQMLGISPDILDLAIISSNTPILLLQQIARDGKILYGKPADFNSIQLKAFRFFYDYQRPKYLKQYLKNYIYA
jgi:predicted nucleotidyltransferase